MKYGLIPLLPVKSYICRNFVFTLKQLGMLPRNLGLVLDLGEMDRLWHIRNRLITEAEGSEGQSRRKSRKPTRVNTSSRDRVQETGEVDTSVTPDDQVMKDSQVNVIYTQEKGDKQISPSMHDGRTMSKGSSLLQSPVVFLGIQSHLQSSTNTSHQHNQFLTQLPLDKDTGDSCQDRKMTGMKVTEYLAWKEGQMEIMDKDKEEQEKFLHSLGLIRSQDVAKRKFEIDLAREKAMKSARELSRRKRTKTLEKAERDERSGFDVKKQGFTRSQK